MKLNKDVKRLRRKKHIRKKIFGTSTRPRVSIFRSNSNISAQAIDDVKGVTIASATSLSAEIKNQKEGKTKKEVAALVGKKLGEFLKDINTTDIVFDRSGYKYHGRVKELADGIRSAGIKY